MKTYMIRVTTIDNLYSDYIVEAINLWQAKEKVKNSFLKSYPNSEPIKLSIDNAGTDVINEVLEIIKREAS